MNENDLFVNDKYNEYHRTLQCIDCLDELELEKMSLSKMNDKYDSEKRCKILMVQTRIYNIINKKNGI